MNESDARISIDNMLMNIFPVDHFHGGQNIVWKSPSWNSFLHL